MTSEAPAAVTAEAPAAVTAAPAAPAADPVKPPRRKRKRNLPELFADYLAGHERTFKIDVTDQGKPVGTAFVEYMVNEQVECHMHIHAEGQVDLVDVCDYLTETLARDMMNGLHTNMDCSGAMFVVTSNQDIDCDEWLQTCQLFEYTLEIYDVSQKVVTYLLC